MTEQNKAREVLLSEVLDWSKLKSSLGLLLATGCGKGKISLELIRRMKSEKILVFVPTVDLQKSYILQMEEHGFGDLIGGVETACYASMKNYKDTEWDVVVFDEGHHLFSEARMKILPTIRAPNKILLSATLNEEKKESISKLLGMKFFEVDYPEAVERGILPEATLHVVKVRLKDIEGKFTLTKKEANLSAEQYYDTISKKIKDAYSKRNKNPYSENRMYTLGGQRQRWLGEIKTKVIERILNKIGDRRAIVFCGSKDQAHLLGGEEAVSSDNSKKENEKIIEEFNQEKTNRIFAKNMLVEGANLKNTQFGVVAGLGSKDLKSTQQIGRILRHPEPIIVVIVVEGTVDERFFKESFGKSLNR